MLRFLLDENVPASLGRALVARGHAADPVPAELRSADDAAILELASRTARVLFTLDRDYGTLAFLRGLVPPPVVILIRLRSEKLAGNLQSVVTTIEASAGAPGSFVVISADGVRVRPLPGFRLH